MKTRHETKNVSITGKVLQLTIASFFVANIMTVIGSVIDGFVIGNAMNESAAAAVGLISPLVILFAVIGATTGISFQSRSLKCLSRGDAAGAGRALIEALTIGLALSVIIMVVTLMWNESIVSHIGIPDGSNSFGPCTDYLRGIAFGVPAMTAMAIMSRGTQIDGNSRIAVVAVIVMATFNILLDIICVNLSDADMFEIALGTSLSYYAGTAVLVWYYRKPGVLIKPAIRGTSLVETLRVNKMGVWGGILAAVSAVTLVLRADVLNFAMEVFRVEDAGLQAYNVQVQVNYIVSALQNSAVSAMFLLSALCRDEEDREGFKKTTSAIIRYDIISAAAISVLMFVFASGISSLYLGNVSDAVMASAVGALRACAVGLIFQMILLLFANYIQLFEHYIISAIVIIIVNFIAPLFGASFGGEVARTMSGDVVVGIFGGVTVCTILATVVLIPILVPIVNRRLRGEGRLWMLPAGFGVSPENELRDTIVSEQAIMEFRDRVLDFCGEKGISGKISYLTALTVEEIALNIVQYGFKRDDKSHTLDIRLVYKEGELILRFRDDCPNFDPRRQYETIFRNDDVSRMIGARIIIAKAKDVSYTSMLDLNNLTIHIEDEPN